MSLKVWYGLYGYVIFHLLERSKKNSTNIFHLKTFIFFIVYLS